MLRVPYRPQTIAFLAILTIALQLLYFFSTSDGLRISVPRASLEIIAGTIAITAQPLLLFATTSRPILIAMAIFVIAASLAAAAWGVQLNTGAGRAPLAELGMVHFFAVFSYLPAIVGAVNMCRLLVVLWGRMARK